MKIVSTQEMKRLDSLAIEKAGISSRKLMYNAGTGVAGEILSYTKTFFHKSHVRRFVIFAGKGNNGGDAYVVAGYLEKHSNVPVIVYSVSEKEDIIGDARFYADKLSSEVKIVVKDLSSEDFQTGDIIIDGLLGTGFTGELKASYKEWIEIANTSGCPVISIDIPSGLDGTTGNVKDTAIIADVTIAIGLPKSGLFINNGSRHTGLLRVVEIGIPKKYVDEADSELNLFTKEDAAKFLHRVPNDSHKKSVGTVLVIGGSKLYKGAPFLSGMAALRAGAGLVTVAIPESCEPSYSMYNSLIIREIRTNSPGSFDSYSSLELTELIKSHNVVVLGPGIGTNSSTAEVVKTVLEHDKKTVIDADALNLIAAFPEIMKPNGNFIFTPHAGEIARLLSAFDRDNKVTENRIFKAERAAELLGGVVVLKGNKTVVSCAGQTTSINSTGSQALSTAGTGDVLSGIMGAFYASGINGFDASRLAAYAHGLSGEVVQQKKGVRGTIADDVIEAIPEAMNLISPLA